MLGVVAGAAVIGGALIVGDSVKFSLRQMTLERLGQIDLALSGPRFFREELAKNLSSQWRSGAGSGSQVKEFAPAIIMQAAVQTQSGQSVRRAGKVNVYGFDERAWSLIETRDIPRPLDANVVLNAMAAEAIDAKVGDEITVWIELPAIVPRDTLMGNKDNDSKEISLTVSAIAPESSGLAKLGLQPTQALPLNAFVDLRLLQDRLGMDEVKPSRRDPIGKPARANSLFVPKLRSTDALVHESDQLIKKSWSPADLNLRVVDAPISGGFVFESEQMILEDKLAAAARQTADEIQLITSPVMVYLANKLWNPKVYQPGKRPGYSMYSTVAGVELPDLDGKTFAGFEFIGPKPATWADDDVIINEFLATDLQVGIGDPIKFTYHTIGSRGELPELEKTVTVRGIVAMKGAAVDRTLVPEVKGITDVSSLADWDQPFPMDLDAVTPRDDEYWDSYRAVPKMFLPLKTAHQLWPSRYGSLTSLRIADSASGLATDAEARKALRDKFTDRLMSRLNPADLGLIFQPVRQIGLSAASGSTDFSGLFIGFSLFLIVAALILIGLLFRLGVEQRVRTLGLLGAIGFTTQQVRQLMLLEGATISIAGGLFGSVAAVGYASFMIYGLTHWWVGAIGTRNLMLSVRPLTLLVSFCIATAAAASSTWWALNQLKGLSIRERLMGATEMDVDMELQRLRSKRIRRRAAICSLLASTLIVGVLLGLVPAAAGFFMIGVLLLIGSLSFLSAWLSSEQGLGVRGEGMTGLSRLGLRNASRKRQRTVMTAGMIATATFLIVTVAAFRRDPTSELPVKSSGNGGFTLVAETSSPILYDINTADGRKKLQLMPNANSPDARLMAEMHVVPFRVKPGEDASCLNLYQTRVPTILGVPQSLIDENRFAFASGNWKDLVVRPDHSAGSTPPATDQPIPVLGDMNTLMFSLHKQVGQTISLADENSVGPKLIVKGMFQDSIFQGVLVMSEENFLKLFPEQKGFRYFLIEVPPQHAQAASSYLETELAEYGFDAEPVADRLARFLSVQNTYLSTFQTLGGLGLLLGTFGLAAVMLRNILERQSELALLRAVGFQRSMVAALVLWENALILLWGLLAGAFSAILATSPQWLSRGGDLPWVSLAVLLVVVLLTGMAAAGLAVVTAARLPIVATLRGE